MKKRIICGIIVCVILFTFCFQGTIVSAASLPFTDVPTSSWYYDAVVYVYESGLMNGTSSTTFSPESTLKREQAVTVIGRLMENLEFYIGNGSTTLTDVVSGSYYYKYVCWAVNNNLIDHPNTTFGVGQSINRQDLAFLLYNACNYYGLTIKTLIPLPSFSDDSLISDSKRAAVYKCAKGNIMIGSSGAFHPWYSLKRSELAQVITNFVAYHQNDYAYVVGANWGQGEVNHIPNVMNVVDWYEEVPGLTVYYNTIPTETYMKGRNPVGLYRIGSSVVYINGHADYLHITVKHNNSENYRTGISALYQIYEGQYAVLNDTDMRGVRLITFVGCNTASEEINLCTTAVARGAKSAVGFNNNTTSTSTANENWIKLYSKYLSIGYPLNHAISRASFESAGSLGDMVVIKGSSSTKIIPSSSLPNMSQEPQTTNGELYEMSTRFDNAEPITNELLINHTDRFESIIAELEQIDPTFNTSDYRVSFHTVNDADGFGLIQFRYCLGADKEILTNKVYTIETTRDYTNCIYYSVDRYSNLEDEETHERIMQLKQRFEETGTGKVLIDETIVPPKGKLINKTEEYYYDYNTGSLHYVEVRYYQEQESVGEIIDRVKEIIIE